MTEMLVLNAGKREPQAVSLDATRVRTASLPGIGSVSPVEPHGF